GQQSVTGIAIVSLDHALAICRFVKAIVAAETSGPILVANIVRVLLPTGVHLREEIVLVNLLNRFNGQPALFELVRLLFTLGISLGQVGGDPAERLSFIGIGPRQSIDR